MKLEITIEKLDSATAQGGDIMQIVMSAKENAALTILENGGTRPTGINEDQWENNPGRMKSGYEYEKTFVEMMKQFELEIFQQSMGETGSKNYKKK